ncbi:MAG: hypothetical protein U5R14_09195 [Gemmatimonadota bacterium]|nr:hypothetical protein [Gemmatimonadota bacterium]
MRSDSPSPSTERTRLRAGAWALAAGLAVGATACTSSSGMPSAAPAEVERQVQPFSETSPPSPDPRVGLGAGLMDAEEAIWNLKKVSSTPPPEDFIGVTNSDLAFKDDYVIQGNYNGFQIWDVSEPADPVLVEAFVCPASQSDVSVYEDLLFVSGEGLGGRVDCGVQGVPQAVSEDRLRGIRIFDISDLRNPEYIANVQTCRGSHTHTVLKDPADDENVYIYVSGSAPVRPDEELPGCVSVMPDEDPNTALFRIEVIQVPLANPEAAEIVSSPRIFENLEAPPTHGPAPADREAIEEAREAGAFVIEVMGEEMILPDESADALLSQVVEQRGGSGPPTAADSAALRERLPSIVQQMMGMPEGAENGAEPGPTQCHDITVYPEIGVAGGACEGYGLLLDIEDPVEPTRLTAVADSNFSYWHSATFNNDGSKVLFTDEWGGGGQPKCRESDPKEWGANAIFTIQDGDMQFESYYKLPAPQTSLENCVAHNGSMIPVPGRDIMVQSWYQGGISIFDWTDPENPFEIAFHDRGPVDSTRQASGGSWSVYWYNGMLVNSEIARGLDIFELEPSGYLTRNEIDAANTVQLDYLNAQGQPQYQWPPSFALARAYVDQLERWDGLDLPRIAAVRQALRSAEEASGSARASTLNTLADELERDASGAAAPEKGQDAGRGGAGAGLVVMTTHPSASGASNTASGMPHPSTRVRATGRSARHNTPTSARMARLLTGST